MEAPEFYETQLCTEPTFARTQTRTISHLCTRSHSTTIVARISLCMQPKSRTHTNTHDLALVHAFSHSNTITARIRVCMQPKSRTHTNTHDLALMHAFALHDDSRTQTPLHATRISHAHKHVRCRTCALNYDCRTHKPLHATTIPNTHVRF